MTTRIGEHEFDHARYDERGDVLYLRRGPKQEAARTHATPEGHAIRYDEADEVIGITLVNAKWLIERDGKLTITVPSLVEARAEDITAALSSA